MKKYCPHCKNIEEIYEELKICKRCGKKIDDIDFIKTKEINMDLLK